MTTLIYFIRHCEPERGISNQMERVLTPKGLADRAQLQRYFLDKKVDMILSSPYPRARQTVQLIAEERNLEIILDPDLRERDGYYFETGFESEISHRWEEPHFKEGPEESMQEMDRRIHACLNRILRNYQNKSVVVGSHGTFISRLIHHFDDSFGVEHFLEMIEKMPWLVRFSFENDVLVDMTNVDLN